MYLHPSGSDSSDGSRYRELPHSIHPTAHNAVINTSTVCGKRWRSPKRWQNQYVKTDEKERIIRFGFVCKCWTKSPFERAATFREPIRNNRPMMPVCCQPISPQVVGQSCKGRSSDLSQLSTPSRPAIEQWPMRRVSSLGETGFTAAGTVADLHSIPF